MARVLILRAPGTSGEEETSFAFNKAGATSVEVVPINRFFEHPSLLQQSDILCLPGGFSFGDDILAGKIYAAKINASTHPAADALQEFRNAGKLILGIGNGFQVLLRSGLLGNPQAMTLTKNQPAKNSRTYRPNRWVHLKTFPSNCVFLQGIESLYLPIAHTEGLFVTRSPEDLSALQAKGQLPLYYVPTDDDSLGTVAGLCDESGRVFGLMPHPERYINPQQHPQWSRLNPLPAEGEGLTLFRNAVRYCA